jgi:hypothetical protein
MQSIDHDKAFSRNIGWVTEAEQKELRNARVAIVGLYRMGAWQLLLELVT